MHYLRLQKHGDVDHEYKGDSTYNWTGDDATSQAVHQRVKKQRGRASTHRCVDCAKAARHWSYDHTDPNEKFDKDKGPYSPDITRYQPRCVSCHKKFDMRFVMAKRRGA